MVVWIKLIAKSDDIVRGFFYKLNSCRSNNRSFLFLGFHFLDFFQGLEAVGAEFHTYETTVNHYSFFLNIGLEGVICPIFCMRHTVSPGNSFSAIITFKSHRLVLYKKNV